MFLTDNRLKPTPGSVVIIRMDVLPDGVADDLIVIVSQNVLDRGALILEPAIRIDNGDRII